MKYTPGKKCRRGHVAKRYAASGQCVKCVQEYRKQVKTVCFKVHKYHLLVLTELVRILNESIDIDD